MNKSKIGFIGQGFIGKNYADDFVERGFETVRYSLEPEYANNKNLIKTCDVVFIAVPTPTIPKGFDDSIVRVAIKQVGAGKIAVIKSTVLPGMTSSIQKENPEIFVLHSPEFLREVSAREDTKHPERNLVGMPVETPQYHEKAELVLSILPEAPYSKIMLSHETELVKYIGNNFLYTKVVFMNIMYDLVERLGARWTEVAEAVSNDSRVGTSHMKVAHPSGLSTESGRGAGGHCFPKDFEALLQFYKLNVLDEKGLRVLESIRDKNIELLKKSGKDAEILAGVYNTLNAQK